MTIQWVCQVPRCQTDSLVIAGRLTKLCYYYHYWFPGLVRKGTYKFTLVSPSVRTCVPVLQPWPFNIFSNFLHEVVSPYDLDDPQKIFRSKNFLTPKMAKNGQNLAIFGQNSHFWVFLAYIFQTPLWIFLIFGMEVVLMVLFEKIILYMPGKFLFLSLFP